MHMHLHVRFWRESQIKGWTDTCTCVVKLSINGVAVCNPKLHADSSQGRIRIFIGIQCVGILWEFHWPWDSMCWDSRAFSLGFNVLGFYGAIGVRGICGVVFASSAWLQIDIKAANILSCLCWCELVKQPDLQVKRTSSIPKKGVLILFGLFYLRGVCAITHINIIVD